MSRQLRMTVPERLGLTRRWEQPRPVVVGAFLLMLVAPPAASISLALSQALGIL
jgi:hypothetical protein